MRSRFLGIEIRRIPRDELKGRAPATAQVDETGAAAPQKDEAKGLPGRSKQQRGTPIAKDERKDAATYINYVDIALKKGYGAIFSDFDDSPYESRVLSRDFIEEVKTRHRLTKEGDIEVRLSVPKKMRDKKDEAVIRKRISEYFKSKAEEVQDEISARQNKGWKYIATGVAISVIATTFLWFFGKDYLLGAILGALMEMSAWITAWSGAERAIMETPKDMREQKEFNGRMARANFVFISTDEVVKSIEKAMERPRETKEKKSAETAATGVPSAEAPASTGPSSAGPSGEPSG